MSQPICLITGATEGVGRATALALAKEGFRVVVAARSRQKADAVRAEIEAKAGVEADSILVDLASLKQVRRAAETFAARHSRLDVLLNNAGVFGTSRTLTEDGFETTFQVNYLSHFLLTLLLLGSIKASAPSRIVNVSSEAHTTARMYFDDLQLVRGYNAFKSYGQSKLAQVLFTHELAKRLGGTGVDAYCVHPGAVATNWGRNAGSWLSIGVRLAAPFEANPRKGARTSVYVSSEPSLEGTSGKYYVDSRESKSSDRSYDDAAASRLWDVSCQMLGIAADSY